MGNFRRPSIRRFAAAAVLFGGLAVAGPAAAQTSTYVGVNPPRVGAADTGSRSVAVPGSLENESGLAFTGADVVELVVLGGAAVGIGMVAVRATRRRARPEGTADEGMVAPL